MDNMNRLFDAVLTGDAKTAKETTQQALAAGVEPMKQVQDFMMPAMAEVGRRFECNEYFVPELLLPARAMKAERIHRGINRVLEIVGGRATCVMGTGAMPFETPLESIRLIREYIAN